METPAFSFDQLTELPFGLAGRVFRSKMPFREDDPVGDVFRQYQQQQVKVVVLLAGQAECEAYTGRNLHLFYQDAGLQVISAPVVDYGVPNRLVFERALEAAWLAAQAGSNLAIHCYAGVGRTGLFAACLAKRYLHLSGEDAIQWVRRYIPGAVETTNQARWVIDF